MKGKTGDIILLVVVIGLVAAALLPVGGGDEQSDLQVADGGVEPSDTAPVEPHIIDREAPIEPGAAKPVLDVPHRFFPIVVGSKWIYRVDGPEDVVPEKTWTMEIVSTPGEDAPGEISVGFGKSRETRNIWIDGETLRTDGLPFTEPLLFKGNKPESTGGALLQNWRYAIEGAVWKHEFTRQVTYESPDERGKIHIQEAKGIQTDRAMVGETEQSIVPAGIFDAIRVDWIGRIELRAENRKVLAELTSEPFRKETTWFVPGVGMVRRRVEYNQPETIAIAFDLVKYERED